MKKILTTLFAFAAIFCAAQASNAADLVPYIDVTAKIDGSDWFEITGNQWRWQHGSYDLPEYHGGVDPTNISFDGNSINFLSSWPNGTGYGALFGLQCCYRFGPDTASA